MLKCISKTVTVLLVISEINTEPSCGNKQVFKMIYWCTAVTFFYQGCFGCCKMQMKNYIHIYTNLNKKNHFLLLHPHNVSKKLLSSGCWKRIFIREWLCASCNCLHFQEKSMRNTGQARQLKTICPEIFFNILTGGCIFNP